MSFVTVAIVGGGVGLISAYAQYQSAQNAANTQRQAANDANAVSQYQYDTTRADNAPWRQAGVGALGQMQDPRFQHSFGLEDFHTDPGYQFQLSEGNKAINAAASARGLNTSGSTMKALTGYGQGLANQSYQQAFDRYNTNMTNQFNRLSSLAGLGQTAQGQTTAAGMNNANTQSGNLIGAGNAQSAAQIAQGNAVSNGLGQGYNSYLNYNLLKNYKDNPWGRLPLLAGAPAQSTNPMTLSSMAGPGNYGLGFQGGGPYTPYMNVNPYSAA